MQNFFEDIGIILTIPFIIYYDNQNFIALVKNLVHSLQTMQLECECHFIQHHVKKGRIELMCVKPKDQLVDIETKALPKPWFLELQDALFAIYNIG